MSFLAMPVAQMSTGPFATANCGPSVTSELISLASVDALKISAQKIRDASGDRSGGIEGSLLATTANKLTGYLYPFLYRRYEEDEWDKVRGVLVHQSVAVIISAGATVRTKYRTNWFTGNHWFTLAGGTIKDGTVKYEDPGTTAAGWQRIPLQLVREAMLATKDLSGRRLNAFFVLETPATEDVKKNAVHRVAVRTQPDRDSRRLGMLDKGEEVHVRRTTRGGGWQRADGTTGHGWHVVTYRGGKGFVKGEGLR